MNGYKSRLRKGKGYIKSINDGLDSTTQMFEGVEYEGKIYFFRYPDQGGYNIKLYSWDGIKNKPTLVNTYTLDNIVYSYRSSDSNNINPLMSTCGLIVYNNGLYIIGKDENDQYMYRLLPSFQKVIDEKNDVGVFYPDNNTRTKDSSSYADSFWGYPFANTKYIVYKGNIHAFRVPNRLCCDYILRNATSLSEWEPYLGQHYVYDGVSWTKASTSSLMFSDEATPFIWDNKLFITVEHYLVQEKHTSAASNTPAFNTNYYFEYGGIELYYWDETNWVPFYSKYLDSNNVPQVSTSSTMARFYYKDFEGNYNRQKWIRRPGGFCVLNNDLYLFGHGSKMFKYSTQENEFILQNNTYPQEADVYTETDPTNIAADYSQYNHCHMTLVPYKGYIYGIGGVSWTYSTTLYQATNDHIYRYNVTTKEWEYGE